MKKRIIIGSLLMLSSLSPAVTHIVTTAAEFNALPTLNAGDHVVMQSGTYGALDKTLNSSIPDDFTAMNNPVLVYAETPGGVEIAAPSKITLSGRGITLAGLNFVSGSGMIDNGSDSATYLIRLNTNSRYMTLSNLRFNNCTAGDDYGYWIYIRGFNNTVEYCSFEGKDEPIRNTVIAITRDTSEAGVSTPRNHIIRRNYFGPRECSVDDNGYETIRIGDSSSQAHSMNVTVEENVFYRSIWRADGEKPNDMEIISNKTADNVFRNNTFLESYGQLTLRHGDRALVEGNYFFGGGYYSGGGIVIGSSNSYQSGVRIIGQDHIIRNNYFVNLQGTSLRAALCLMGGSADFDDGDGSGGDNGYEAAHGAQIHHNTFVGCRQMNLGYYGSGGDTQPANCDLYNNAWQGSGSSDAIIRPNGFNEGNSGGNYIYMPGGDYGWTGLTGTYTDSASPQINEAYDNYLIPSSSSPLLGAAVNQGVVTADIRGLLRPGSGVDIGSFEREVAGVGSGPLLRSEVGPLFDGGPAGTYPVGGSQSDLTVASPYGSPTPAVGTASYDNDTLINASMSGSPEVSGTTRYVVTGWTGTGDVVAGSGSGTSFTLTQNSSITWQWQTQYFLDTGATVGGSVNVADGWYDSGSGISITATPAAGYYFSHWTGDSSSSFPVLNLTMNSAKAVTAVFVSIGPELTVASPYGSPTPAVGVHSYDDGTLVNASISGSPEVSGTTRQVVTGWTGTGNVVAGSGDSTSFTLTQDSTLTWLWQTQYFLDTETSGSGSVDVADTWFDSGANVTVTASPAAGHIFVNWSGDSSSTSPVLNLSMDAAKSVTANFVSAADLTVASPYGTPIPAVGTSSYAAGTEINASMSGSPAVSGTTRHLVTGWTGTGDVVAGSGDSTSFTLNQNSTLTWVWQTQYWLDTEVSGNGIVDVADTWFDAGSSVTITATPAVDHHFVSWSGDSSSTNPVLNLTLDAAKTVTATFAADPVPPLAIRIVQSVSASGYDTNNAAIPENTLDGDLGTRWSALGDDVWISYDLGVSQTIYELKIAWYNGDQRTSTNDVLMSTDGTNWTAVLTGYVSSGTNLNLETVNIPNTSGRYVRIVGHGNSANDWTSLTEVEIWGAQADLPAEVYIPAPEPAGGGVQFVVPSESGALYQLQYTDILDPPSWEDVGTPVFGDGGDLILMDPGPITSNRFYRLYIVP